jgi:16S rRNA C967 or C1407 C5-methylase (RsmB/RsmF family)/NOL1/NOP2/fmu family ribosome biogenesis protein
LKDNIIRNLPKPLLDSLHGIKGYDIDAFEASHRAANPPVSVRLNKAKYHGGKMLKSYMGEAVAWCNTGHYLTHRPAFTLDPLLHAGVYYVQEASSMFIEQAISYLGMQQQAITALDVCAAPGGKSTHLQSLLHPESVLVCNEVIATRNAILQENLTKWGTANVIVTQNDPVQLGQLGACFDLILTDAPCSGSGLFRRDPEAIPEWSPANVKLCSQRQQRILADVLPALKPNGILIYSTCSYSEAENENIADWLIQMGMESVKLPWPDGKSGVVVTYSRKTQAVGYRFFPHLVKGEGFFMAVFRKLKGTATKTQLKMTTKAEKLPSRLQNWIKPDVPLVAHKQGGTWFGMTAATYYFFIRVQKLLYIKKAGFAIAQEAAKDFLPEHALAMSTLLNASAFLVQQVNEAQSLLFLRRQELNIDFYTKGWYLIVYEGYALGWLKYIGNRYNNYYPKEWRIKMA